MAFKISITDFADGNENTVYMTLPADKNIIETAKNNENVMLRICGCEEFPELVDIDFDEKPTLDELNYLAGELEKVAESDIDTAAYRGLLRDGIYSIRNAISCALNVKSVAVYPCKDLEEYGKLSMKDLLFGEFDEVPYNADGSIDYKKIGQIEQEKNGGCFIGDYYVMTETYSEEIKFDGLKPQSETDIAEEKSDITMGGIS